MNNHDLYRSNRKTKDIVYLYTNGETDRYIKTEEGISPFHYYCASDGGCNHNV